MKKEDFINLGIDEEVAKKCETASEKELKNYVTKAQFEEVTNEKKKLELDVTERDKQLETLKNSTGNVDELKTQIEKLQNDNKEKDELHASEIKQLKINSAVENAINGVKGKNVRAIKALLDLEDAELKEDGTVKGLDDQIKALTKAEDSKFLFETNSSNKFKGVAPGESNNSLGDGKADVSKMNYEQLTAYMEANPGVEI